MQYAVFFRRDITQLILFLLFLLPFVYFPLGISPYELSKVLVASVGIELLLLLTIIRYKKTLLHKLNKTHVLLVLTFLAISFLHLVFAFSWTSFFGNVYRFQGILVFWLLLVFSLLSSIISLKRIPLLFPLLALFSLVVLALLLGTNSNGRMVATLGEPNALAATVIFLWPFIITTKEERKVHVFIKGITVVMVMYVLLVTQSHSGLIAFILQLFFFLLQKFRFLSLSKTVIVALLFLLVSFTLPFFQHTSLYENRADVWKAAYFAGKESPFIGNGFGNMIPIFHRAAVKQVDMLVGYTVDSSHNIFLDFFVEGGIIGLAVFMLLVFFAIRNFIMAKKKLELVVILGLLAVLSFNPASIVALVQLWWVIGRGFAQEAS